MFDFMTDRNHYYQLPVEFLKDNLNADKSLSIEFKVNHAPCPPSGVSTVHRHVNVSGTFAVADDATPGPEDTSTASSSPGDKIEMSSTEVTKAIMEGLRDDEEYSDFFLFYRHRLGSIPCHKAVLALRSPVFKKMIAEGAKSVIEEFTLETLDHFQSFLYTGAFITEEDNRDGQPSWITALPEVAQLAAKVIKISSEIETESVTHFL